MNGAARIGIHRLIHAVGAHA